MEKPEAHVAAVHSVAPGPEHEVQEYRQGWYQFSSNFSIDTADLKHPIACYDAGYDRTPAVPLPDMCTRCGLCADCSIGTPRISAGYVRIFGPTKQRGQPEHLVAPITIFRCIYDTGCFGETWINSSLTGCKTCHDQTIPLTAGCQATYTGHFCSQCADDYELKLIE
eukprot:COSAG03_NODE_10728_length_632_cov_1.086304_1_plen_166_part_10